MLSDEIREEAISFAKLHKKKIALELVEPCQQDESPVSIFMAGSPGAGKTEFSKELLRTLDENSRSRILRIDGDELRTHFNGYIGSNSGLFHGAISILVDKIHDMALKRGCAFILDGTFSKYEKAEKNIQRSLDKSRGVIIFMSTRRLSLRGNLQKLGRKMKVGIFQSQYLLMGSLGLRRWLSVYMKNLRRVLLSTL